MQKRNAPSSVRKRSAAGMTLGRTSFAKISAVEGIRQTAAMKKRAANFDRLGLSASERRQAIIRVYRKD